MRENQLQREIQIMASNRGARLFRNNQGLAQYGDHKVRYGIAQPGGSDLIGWYSTTITPDMVGQRVAVFTAIEVKGEGAKTEPHRLRDQKRFILAVRASGGIAAFADNLEKAEATLCFPQRSEADNGNKPIGLRNPEQDSTHGGSQPPA